MVFRPQAVEDGMWLSVKKLMQRLREYCQAHRVFKDLCGCA